MSHAAHMNESWVMSQAGAYKARKRARALLREHFVIVQSGEQVSLSLSLLLLLSLSLSLSLSLLSSLSLCLSASRGGGLGSSTIFKKFNETYAPS